MMKRVLTAIGVAIALLLCAGMVGAKDCPSNLGTNLHETDNFAFGGEFRFWSYYVDQYDYEKQTRFDTNYNYWSVRGAAEYSFSDALYAGVEGILRNTEFADEDFQCASCSADFRVDLRQLWLTYESDAVSFHVGRDLLAFGNSMILDNFFDQVSMQFDAGAVSFRAGGGALANDVAREAVSCQRGGVYEYYPYWKQTLDAAWDDHLFGFVETNFALRPKQYQQILLLYTDSAVDPAQDAWIGDLFLNGTLPGGVKYFMEGALQYYSTSANVYGGASFIASKSMAFAGTKQQFQFGALVAQRDTAQRFAPIYESLWLGERYRYSVYEGDLLYLKNTVNFDNLKPISLVTQYTQKISGARSDELDVGLQLSFTEKYRFFLTYSALNLTGDYEMTHQFQFHTRLLF